jgi:rhodanese-related sulfurtransferase
MTAGPGHSIDEILATARKRLRRLPPAQAYQAMSTGALLVDIRSQTQRAAQGLVPGALRVERNELEWRFDPRSDAKLPQASFALHVIIMCAQGYSSSLAAASLQDLGLYNATDVIGGFEAWAAAGLPVNSQELHQQGAQTPARQRSAPCCCAGLAHGHRAQSGRPGRWLHRCPPPVPAARRRDPPPGRRSCPRYRHLLPVVRPTLLTAAGP